MFFYGYYNYRFVFILIACIIVNYTVGRLLQNQYNHAKRKLILFIALIYNLGALAVFKYFDFFISSILHTLNSFGGDFHFNAINILIPVGISFFTFQSLGYIFDVYRKKYEPTKDIVAFSAFVCFFPLILAGPIERGDHLLPQFKVKRNFDYPLAVNGLKQILWGLFKKIIIADNLANTTSLIFNNYNNYAGGALLLGAFLFTIQIYADFSGYSDIAIGVSRLLGFNIVRNFNSPYFSISVADFWRRWHISLSSWLRDYLFVPLSIKIRNWGKSGVVFSMFITFLLCGLWHGANYTFIVWGGLHGLALVWDIITMKQRKTIKKQINKKLYNFISWTATFLFLICTWIFFKADNIGHALHYLKNLFAGLLLKKHYVQALNIIYWNLGLPVSVFLCVFFIIEWLGRKKQFPLEDLGIRWCKVIRWALYLGIALIIFLFSGKEQAFIYFQF